MDKQTTPAREGAGTDRDDRRPVSRRHRKRTRLTASPEAPPEPQAVPATDGDTAAAEAADLPPTPAPTEGDADDDGAPEPARKPRRRRSRRKPADAAAEPPAENLDAEGANDKVEAADEPEAGSPLIGKPRRRSALELNRAADEQAGTEDSAEEAARADAPAKVAAAADYDRDRKHRRPNSPIDEEEPDADAEESPDDDDAEDGEDVEEADVEAKESRPRREVRGRRDDRGNGRDRPRNGDRKSRRDPYADRDRYRDRDEDHEFDVEKRRADREAVAAPAKDVRKDMLINVTEGEEVRVALLEDGHLEELYIERVGSTTNVGSIYLGKVTNVESSIQAAFVDFGVGRNGFLHVQDLHPWYMGKKGERFVEKVGKKLGRRDRPPIQDCLRRGDEIMVQVIKEGIGTKGPTISSYISIPGRFLVMMPGVTQMGVSKKIEDEAERKRLRKVLDGLSPPEDVGFIIRTAGVGKTKAELERDFKYLVRLWEAIDKKRKSSRRPVALYAEGDLVLRTIRDVWTSDVERLVIDDPQTLDQVEEFFKLSMPRTKRNVELYEGELPLFHKFGIEREVEKMFSREVPLPSGGSLVIDSTEAAVCIDVNSGKFRVHDDAEETAFRTDLEAADEIARQLRLRDLGGQILIDFIDLRYRRHREELFDRLTDLFKRDKAKSRHLPMNEFGIVAITRQRMRPDLKKLVFMDCPLSKGTGLIKTPESMSLDVLRRLRVAAADERVRRVEVTLYADVALHLLNGRRIALAELEKRTGVPVVVRADQGLPNDDVKLTLFDDRDGLVFLPALDVTPEGYRADQDYGRRGRRDRGRDRDDDHRPRREARPVVTSFGAELAEEADDAAPSADGEESTGRRKRRRRRRRGRGEAGDDQSQSEPRAAEPPEDDEPEAADAEVPEADGPINEEQAAEEQDDAKPARRRRRRRGRGRGRSETPEEPATPDDAGPEDVSPPADAAAEPADEPDESETGGAEAEVEPEADATPRRRRRRTGAKVVRGHTAAAADDLVKPARPAARATRPIKPEPAEIPEAAEPEQAEPEAAPKKPTRKKAAKKTAAKKSPKKVAKKTAKKAAPKKAAPKKAAKKSTRKKSTKKAEESADD